MVEKTVRDILYHTEIGTNNLICEENRYRSLIHICTFYNILISHRYPFTSPFVSSDEDDVITFEWWGIKRKKLTIYNTNIPYFVRIEGSGIDIDVVCGDIKDKENFLDAWHWLHV
jgi:hypothetical protein